mmetsp:Transcript_106885/g.300538  ORF Transcript_106885/g.300538 Transcript_106885/m.300538 type:complete len:278 (+) Transcript_106885:375-1208(+)
MLSGSTCGPVRNCLAIASAVRLAALVQVTITCDENMNSLRPLRCVATASICRLVLAASSLPNRTSTSIRPLSLRRSGPPPFQAAMSAPSRLFQVMMPPAMCPAAPMETTCFAPLVSTSTRVTDAWRRVNMRQAWQARSIGTPAARINKYRIMLLCATTNSVVATSFSGGVNSLMKTSSARRGLAVGSVSRSRSAFHTSMPGKWLGNFAAVSRARRLVLCNNAHCCGNLPAAQRLATYRADSSACWCPCWLSSFSASASPWWQHCPCRSNRSTRRPRT